MAKIPKHIPITTIQQIDAAIPVPDKPRDYLGMSSLGGDCDAQKWYGWRWASPRLLPVRVKRIFERGDIEEARVIRSLKSVGCEVYRWDGDTKVELDGHIGEEQQEVIGFAGHVKGHTDGEVIGIKEAPKTPHLLETKTCNQSKFKAFIRHGMRATWPVYYGQCQLYMHYRKLKRAFFIATNKNTEEYHAERVHYDKDYCLDLINKSVEIVTSEGPPHKQYTSSYFKCGWCNHREVCHFDATPQRNCRTCKYADIEDEGQWSCAKRNNKILSFEKQLIGCKKYRRLF